MITETVESADGTPIERLQLPEAAYTLVKGGGEAWAPVTARFQSGMFVDLRRVLHPSVAGQGAA